MKKQSTFLIISLAFGLSLTACNEKESSDAAPTDNAAMQTICPVSGEELGSMGDPVIVMHEGKEIKLCCDSCVPKFNADPAKFAAKLP